MTLKIAVISKTDFFIKLAPGKPYDRDDIWEMLEDYCEIKEITLTVLDELIKKKLDDSEWIDPRTMYIFRNKYILIFDRQLASLKTGNFSALGSQLTSGRPVFDEVYIAKIQDDGTGKDTFISINEGEFRYDMAEFFLPFGIKVSESGNKELFRYDLHQEIGIMKKLGSRDKDMHNYIFPCGNYMISVLCWDPHIKQGLANLTVDKILPSELKDNVFGDAYIFIKHRNDKHFETETPFSVQKEEVNKIWSLLEKNKEKTDVSQYEGKPPLFLEAFP